MKIGNYMVTGGVYEDFLFKEVEKDKAEIYGPFISYKEAYDIWKSKVWINVDNALHRLDIMQIVN